MVTAAKNPDGSIAIVLFNEGFETKSTEIILNEKSVRVQISAQAIQTILIPEIKV